MKYIFILLFISGVFQHSFGQTIARTYTKLDSMLSVDTESFDIYKINAIEGVSLDYFLPSGIDTLELKKIIVSDREKALRYFSLVCLKMYQFHKVFFHQGYYLYTMREPREQFIFSHLKEIMGTYLEPDADGLIDSGSFYRWYLKENPYPNDHRAINIMNSIKKELDKY